MEELMCPCGRLIIDLEKGVVKFMYKDGVFEEFVEYECRKKDYENIIDSIQRNVARNIYVLGGYIIILLDDNRLVLKKEGEDKYRCFMEYIRDKKT